MRHVLALVLVLLGFGGFIAAQAAHVSAADDYAAYIKLDGAIDSVSAGFLSRGIESATEDGAQFIIVLLDTPGGLLSSTRDMVEAILTSDIPVVVYVYPPGAQAASAGTFVTAAAHVAAMAPTTNIGAASPVGQGGEDLPETLKSKSTQDAAAFMRSIAEERDRNAEALEQTVLTAVSYSTSEALAGDMIDLIAENLNDLLAQLDGKRLETDRGEAVLDTDGLELRRIKRTPLERFLGFLADPNIAFLLLTLGGIGILIEFLNPGVIVPGLFGAIALALAFVAIGNLPVNWVGVGLIGLAMVLFFLEIQAPGIGVFGVGGGVSFILGAFLLFGGFGSPSIPTPGFRVSLWLIGTVSAILFGFVVLLLRVVLQSRGAVYSTGIASLVGQTGTTATELAPHGSVQVASELWSAVSDSDETIAAGEKVVVLDVEGLTLKVFRAPDTTE